MHATLSYQMYQTNQSLETGLGFSYGVRSYNPFGLSGAGARSKKRIVIVDDDQAIRKIYKNALSYFGFDIIDTMSDGSEIVEKIDAMVPRPDVVILDERMPRMSGTEACRRIHASYPDVSVIFVSADSAAEKTALEAGANYFFKKPVSISELARAIESV